LAQQPVIQLRDAGGNPVSLAGVMVTAGVASGGGTLGGTASVATDATGAARFTDLSITGTIGNRTLGFSAPSLTGATSATVTLTAGPATQLSITIQPSSVAVSGVQLQRQPAIQLRDMSGNLVQAAGVPVTVDINFGPGSLGGTLTRLTNASGLATFTNLVLTGSGSYTLRFSSGTLTDAVSIGILVF
jgi:hypothetical protein